MKDHMVNRKVRFFTFCLVGDMFYPAPMQDISTLSTRQLVVANLAFIEATGEGSVAPLEDVLDRLSNILRDIQPDQQEAGGVAQAR